MPRHVSPLALFVVMAANKVSTGQAAVSPPGDHAVKSSGSGNKPEPSNSARRQRGPLVRAGGACSH